MDSFNKKAWLKFPFYITFPWTYGRTNRRDLIHTSLPLHKRRKVTNIFIIHWLLETQSYTKTNSSLPKSKIGGNYEFIVQKSSFRQIDNIFPMNLPLTSPSAKI